MAARNLISTNWATVQSYFEHNGYTTPQAQGLTAAFAAESGLDPSALQGSATSLSQVLGGRGGFGLPQFTSPDRQSAAVGTFGNLVAQLDRIRDELNTTEHAAKTAITSQTTAAGALHATVNSFLRPSVAGNTGDINRGTAALNTNGGRSYAGLAPPAASAPPAPAYNPTSQGFTSAPSNQFAGGGDALPFTGSGAGGAGTTAPAVGGDTQPSSSQPYVSGGDGSFVSPNPDYGYSIHSAQNPDVSDSTGAAGDSGGASQFDGNSGLGHSSDAFSTSGGAGATSLTGGGQTTADGTVLPGVGQTGTGTGGGGVDDTSVPGLPGVSTTGSGSFNSPTATPSAPSDAAPAAPSTDTGSGTAATGVPGVQGASPTAGGTSAAPTAKSSGGGGNPVSVVSDDPEIQSANAIAKAATGVGSSITSAEGNAAVAGTTWLGNIFSAGTDIFARSTFVILGLMILAGAGLFFFIESQKGGGGGGVTILPVPV